MSVYISDFTVMSSFAISFFTFSVTYYMKNGFIGIIWEIFPICLGTFVNK